MVEGWRPVVVAEELYDAIKEYYEKNKDELRLKHGIRSVTAFVNFCIREYLKEKEII